VNRGSADVAPWRGGPVWGRWLGRFLARVIWDTQLVGVEHVPTSGPVVLAANHTGVIDGPLLIGMAPRPLHVLVKQEMFHGPVGALLRAAGQIPVDRSSGRAALQAGLAVLRRDGALGIFPEGNRGRGAVEDTRAGAAWLAVNGGAVLVPVAILGTRRTGETFGHVPGLRRHLVMELGEPIVVDTSGSRREQIERTSAQLRAALAALVADAQQRSGLRLPADDPRRSTATS